MPFSWLSSSEYLAAFSVGLLGGVHCLGMCGGIVGALGFSQTQPNSTRRSSRLPILLAYNGGRISSYTLAGALMGGVGSTAFSLTGLQQAQQGLLLLAGIFMLLLGLYLGGIWHGLRWIEQAGAGVWRHIEPLGRHFIPVKSIQQAFPLGMVWGWLPCGLVYSVLIWSLSAGSALKGALLMLAFGLGTLPNLLAMGVFANRLMHWTRLPAVRLTAGLLICLLGVWMMGRWWAGR